MSAGTVGAFSRKRAFEPGVEKHDRRGRFRLRWDMRRMLMGVGDLARPSCRPAHAARSAGTSCSLKSSAKRAGAPATNRRHRRSPST